jgi:hypothetical protein
MSYIELDLEWKNWTADTANKWDISYGADQINRWGQIEQPYWACEQILYPC